MSEAHKTDHQPERDAAETRQPYQPPAVAWQEDWDVRANLAAACAKRGGDSTECNMDPAS
jgi:hypothetical protein